MQPIIPPPESATEAREAITSTMNVLDCIIDSTTALLAAPRDMLPEQDARRIATALKHLALARLAFADTGVPK